MDYFMNCQKCGLSFPERELQESHDVPCYMFKGKDRKERKNQADKEGRHWLCVKCHDIYERMVFAYMIQDAPENQRLAMIQLAKLFAIKYFKKEGEDVTTS